MLRLTLLAPIVSTQTEAEAQAHNPPPLLALLVSTGMLFNFQADVFKGLLNQSKNDKI